MNNGKLYTTAQLNQAANKTCASVTVTTNCVEQFTGATFPVNGYYFDCTNGAQLETSLLSLMAQFEPNAKVNAAMSSGSIYLYVFTTYDAYSAAFTAAGVQTVANSTNGAGGYSYYLPPTGANYSAMFTLPFGVGGAAPDSGQITEASNHELGHQLDYLNGWTNGSANSTPATSSFDVAMQNDFATADYDNFATKHLRAPCSINGQNGATYTGPLVGLIDYDNSTPEQVVYICSNGQPTAYWAKFLGATGLNSDVLRHVNANTGPIIEGDAMEQQASKKLGTAQYPGGWLEWYATAFALQADLDDQGSPVTVNADQVVLNGYFQCTAGNIRRATGTMNGWLAQVYIGTTPVMPKACQTANLPADWETLH